MSHVLGWSRVSSKEHGSKWIDSAKIPGVYECGCSYSTPEMDAHILDSFQNVPEKSWLVHDPDLSETHIFHPSSVTTLSR